MASRDFRSVPPPKSLNSRQAYAKYDNVYQSTSNEKFGAKLSNFSRKKFGDDEDDYFEHEDAEELTDKIQKEQPSDDEEDPLDAFMAELNKSEQSIKNKKETNTKSKNSTTNDNSTKKSQSAKGVRQDIEDEDVEESYYKYMESNPNAGLGTFIGDSDEENANADNDSKIEYDDDGNPILPSKKLINPLPMVYHSEIDYPPFEKNFYQEHEDIRKLSNNECNELRKKLGIRVSGPSPPKPCSSFAHFGFDEALMKVIRKMEFTQPTPIQAQAIPAALSGRDVMGIAKTGSGKTAAYLWPLLAHILDQPALKPKDGPIGLILAPTRELSQQIYQEAKKFAKVYNIHVLCAYGGGNKYEQSKDLEQGADIVVATPGRMIDFVKMKATNLLRVTYLVLDEADRMFDMGFEPQVRSICNNVRPDRQSNLFY